jgi:hypothetical protein
LPGRLFCPSHGYFWPRPATQLQANGRNTNKNKGSSIMFKQAKYRQASLIVLATTVILILPNVTRLVG